MDTVARADAHRYLALATSALRRPHSPFRELPARLILVDVERQRTAILEQDEVKGELPASSSAVGIGGQAGSHRTPPGWHRVAERIGAGAAVGAVFRSREDCGEAWRGEPRDEDLILTRILWLDGLEEGINRGPGRSEERRVGKECRL